MQHTWRRRLLSVARAVIDERVRRTRRARARRCPCARWTAGSGSSSASTPTASTAPSPASPTARRRRGALRSTPDERSSRAADETSEAIERAGAAMVAWLLASKVALDTRHDVRAAAHAHLASSWRRRLHTVRHADVRFPRRRRVTAGRASARRRRSRACGLDGRRRGALCFCFSSGAAL